MRWRSPGNEVSKGWTRAEVEEYKSGLETKRVNNQTPAYQYQRRTAGDTEYLLKAQTGEKVWADGLSIKEDGAVAVEAKYVVKTGPNSMYEGNGPDFLMEGFDREMRRYSAVIQDPTTPVDELRLVTNTDAAADYLRGRAQRILGEDARLTVVVEK